MTCTCGHTATAHRRWRECEYPGCLCGRYQKNSARSGGNRAGAPTEGGTSMSEETVHPMQGYLDELDALLGQMTTLKYAIAAQILADRSAMRSSNPADKARVLAHYAGLVDEVTHW